MNHLANCASLLLKRESPNHDTLMSSAAFLQLKLRHFCMQMLVQAPHDLGGLELSSGQLKQPRRLVEKAALAREWKNESKCCSVRDLARLAVLCRDIKRMHWVLFFLEQKASDERLQFLRVKNRWGDRDTCKASFGWGDVLKLH